MSDHQLLCQQYMIAFLIRKGLIFLLKSMGILLFTSAETDSIPKS